MSKVHPYTPAKDLPSKVVSAVCDAVHLAIPEIPRKVCIIAGNILYDQGKKITVASVASRAKQILNNAQNMSNYKYLKGPVKRAVVTGVKGGTSTFLGGGIPISGMPASQAPVAISRSVRKSKAPRTSMRGNAMVIAHSEMLGSILSGNPTSNVTAFRCIGLRANPGISSVFPWLSSVAVNYEKYRFKRLTFTIVPLVATNFSGRIGVGFDYDSTDNPPGNRQEFYALSNHAENMPWEASRISVKCDASFKFTGTHNAADNKLIDLGQVILMSDAISNGGTIGSALPLYDLIVDYEVELIEPQQALFATQSFNSINTNLVAGVPLGTGVDTTVISGPNVVQATTVSNTLLGITLPAGTYLITFLAKWSSGGATAVLTTTTSAATITSQNAGGTSFAMVFGSVSCPSDINLVITISGVGFLANLARFNLMVSRVGSSVAQNFVV